MVPAGSRWRRPRRRRVLGHGQTGFVEEAFGRGSLRVLAQKMQIDGHQQQAGLREEPHWQRQRGRVRMERRAAAGSAGISQV